MTTRLNTTPIPATGTGQSWTRPTTALGGSFRLASFVLAAGLLVVPGHAQTSGSAEQADSAGQADAAEPVDGSSAGGEAGGATPLSPDRVVARVNGRAITEGDLALALGPPQPGQPPQTPEQRRASALSALIDLRAVAGRAVEAGLENEDLERRLAFLRDRELHNAYLEQTIEPAITEALMRERYDQEVGAVEPVEEIRASHILLETEEEAREVITALDGGADFAELARARSTGPSAAQGGDLGFFGPGRMVPAFDQAARATPVGEYSREPVETQFGFHVINVTDTREVGPPPFEQVREQIREILRRELYVETLREARGGAEIEIEDQALARLLPPTRTGGAQDEVAAPDGDATEQSEDGAAAGTAQ